MVRSHGRCTFAAVGRCARGVGARDWAALDAAWSCCGHSSWLRLSTTIVWWRLRRCSWWARPGVGACVVWRAWPCGFASVRSASHTLANSPRVCCCIGDTVDGVRFPADSVPSALRTRPWRAGNDSRVFSIFLVWVVSKAWLSCPSQPLVLSLDPCNFHQAWQLQRARRLWIPRRR